MNDQKREQKRKGLRALSAVQAVFPAAVLAGGFIRDYVTGREPKDIDIFIPYADMEAVDIFESLTKAAPLAMAEYIERGEVLSIWDLQGFDLPVQVIMLKEGFDVVERVKHHDFGICQVWHDGKKCYGTEAFYRDLYDHTFTLVHCEDRAEYARSMRRWERLKEKFPGWELRVRGDMELPA